MSDVSVLRGISGSFGVQMFLSGEQYKMFIPMMESLKSFGITGPNGLLQLYYLSCWHEFERYRFGLGGAPVSGADEN